MGGNPCAARPRAATEGARGRASVLHAWFDRVLLPELRRTKPDAVLVLDNLGAHKTRDCRIFRVWSAG